MNKRRAFVIVGTVLLLSLTTRPSVAQRPNILFIITDQQSADVMSCRMGRQYIHTPAMDGLAASGTLFTRAYSPNPLCMPARASIFTGRYPHQTGVTMNGRPKDGRRAEDFVCMGAYFRDADYKTAYSGKWHLCYSANKPEVHGFEILKAGKKVTPPEDDNYDARVSHAALEFLDRPHDRPFLLVVSYLNPHNICEWARRGAGRKQTLNCGEIGTPPPLAELPPAPANLDPPQNEPDGMSFMRRAYQVENGPFPVARFTADDWRKQRWGYYRMVEKVDGEIGKLLDMLRTKGIEKDTLVILTSDHGDCVGAHRFNQKTVFYDESVRIPLIVSWRGKTDAGTCDKLVNTGIDLLPTMLAAAGIEQPKELPGRNLLPLATDLPFGPWREYLVSQNNMVQSGTVDGIHPTMEGRMVRTDRYKYCLYAHGNRRESLYDLKNDPLETVNLAEDPEYHQVLLEHRAKLAEFAKKHEDNLVPKLLTNEVEPRPFEAK